MSQQTITLDLASRVPEIDETTGAPLETAQRTVLWLTILGTLVPLLLTIIHFVFVLPRLVPFAFGAMGLYFVLHMRYARTWTWPATWHLKRHLPQLLALALSNAMMCSYAAVRFGPELTIPDGQTVVITERVGASLVDSRGRPRRGGAMFPRGLTIEVVRRRGDRFLVRKLDDGSDWSVGAESLLDAAPWSVKRKWRSRD